MDGKEPKERTRYVDEVGRQVFYLDRDHLRRVSSKIPLKHPRAIIAHETRNGVDWLYLIQADNMFLLGDKVVVPAPSRSVYYNRDPNQDPDYCRKAAQVLREVWSELDGGENSKHKRHNRKPRGMREGGGFWGVN